MNKKMYVLQHKSGMFFKEQNLYLATASLTNDIDSACQLSLDDAENKYKCMTEKDDWKIYRITLGLRLGEESKHHIKMMRKEYLEKELKAINKAINEM